MKCPFLRDANVKYCEASAYRKMIARAATVADSERCSSSSYVECPAAAARLDPVPQWEHCPYLHESHAEFCAAAPVTKYVPATNDLLSRCNGDGHVYCELYLAHADPEGDRRPKPHGEARTRLATGVPLVDGIPVPPELSYTPNHMWLDVAEDGQCHVGLDGFAAKVIGHSEKVTFVMPRGSGRPVAVLRVNGVDVQMMFPNAFIVTAANAYLRRTPEKLTDDPYGAGWLFEGFCSTGSELRDGLIDGDNAYRWIGAELQRLDGFVHELSAAQQSDGARFMADGGTVEDGIAARLEPEQLISLVTEFFGSRRSW